MSKDKNSRLVYSTETGRIKEEKPVAKIPQGDGIVRIRRETAGRNGKGVTTITGVPLEQFNECVVSNKYLGWAANSTQAFYDGNAWKVEDKR